MGIKRVATGKKWEDDTYNFLNPTFLWIVGLLGIAVCFMKKSCGSSKGFSPGLIPAQISKDLSWPWIYGLVLTVVSFLGVRYLFNAEPATPIDPPTLSGIPKDPVRVPKVLLPLREQAEKSREAHRPLVAKKTFHRSPASHTKRSLTPRAFARDRHEARPDAERHVA